MLALIISFIVVLFTCYIYGITSLITLDRAGLKSTNYTFVDIILCGLFTLTLVTQIWSLFLPTDKYLLLFFILGGVVLCFLFKNHIHLQKSKETFFILSSLIIVFSILLISCWDIPLYDSEFYHYQTMLWNENYRVIPGLANLEDRFGFNSNYLLLSSLFSMNKGVFKEPIISLNCIFSGVMFAYFIYKTILKKQSKYLFSFIIYSLFFISSRSQVCCTSTDFLLQTFIFYLLGELIINPTSLYTRSLSFFIIPTLLLTFKLSAFFILLISILLSIHLIHKKNFKKLTALVVFTSIMLIGWLIRNYIITGYLVYPIYYIDLFNPDWKLPIEFAKMQTNFIHIFPTLFNSSLLENPISTFINDPLSNLRTLYFYGAVLSLIVSMFLFFLQKEKNKISFFVIIICLCNIFFIIKNGFDIRFLSGTLLTSYLLILCNLKLKYIKLKFQYFSITAITILILVIALRSTYYNYKSITGSYYLEDNPQFKREITSVLIKPFPAYIFTSMTGNKMNYTSLYEGKIDNKLNIYLGKTSMSAFKFPVLVEYNESIGRFVNYECIKMRGYKVTDGFKTDKNCLQESLNKKYGIDNFLLK